MLVTSVGEERAIFCYRLLVIMWFLFGEVSSSSWCLGWAALLYCCTPWAFHIIILKISFLSMIVLIDLFLAKHNVEYSMSIPRRDKGCTPILVRFLRQSIK